MGRKKRFLSLAMVLVLKYTTLLFCIGNRYVLLDGVRAVAE